MPHAPQKSSARRHSACPRENLLLMRLLELPLPKVRGQGDPKAHGGRPVGRRHSPVYLIARDDPAMTRRGGANDGVAMTPAERVPGVSVKSVQANPPKRRMWAP
jgi:hypothetical protein